MLAFRKVAGNPLENSYWSNLLEGAANALEVVAIGSLDWKLAAIAKLLKSWLDDRRKEKEDQRLKTEYGYNYQQVGGGPAEPDTWTHTYY